MKTAKLCKVYRGEYFIGFGLAIDGELISNLISTTLTTKSDEPNDISAVFSRHMADADNPITINLDAPKDH